MMQPKKFEGNLIKIEDCPIMLQYLYEKIDSKCLKIIRSFDVQITRNLKEAGIETRPVKSNGLWCCLLLPSILVIYNILYNVSPLYKLVTYISVGLLCYCLLFTLFMTVSCLILKESGYGGCIASSLVSALLIYTFLGQNLTFSLIFSVPSLYLCSMLLRLFLTMFPKTFTIGEAMIITQSLVLFAVTSIAKITCELDERNEEMDFIIAVDITILSTVGLIVTALNVIPDNERDLMYLSYTTFAGVVYAVVMMHTVVGINCVPKIVQYIFFNSKRVELLTFWIFLVVIAVFVLLMRTRLAVKATTVTRKSFHVLASLVFLSGIICDIYFMTLAAGIGLGVLILVEALRKSDIEPISPALQSAFLVYSDEKDSGCFAMTPMYLYLALACPLLLVPEHIGSDLELLSGVLSVGVGDTAASWFGARYGFNKWSDGDRTLEGTTFNILSQVATIYALQIFELLDSNNALIRSAFAATVVALVEAKTDQVDNLILPLVMLIAFQATSFLC